MCAADPYFAMKVLRCEGDLLIFGGDPFIPPGSSRGGDEIVTQPRSGASRSVGQGRAAARCRGDRRRPAHRRPGHDKRRRPDPGTHRGRSAHILCLTKAAPRAAAASSNWPRTCAPTTRVTLQGNGTGSLMTLPVEGVSMADLQHIIYRFQIERGGPTADPVAIRNHLDQMKGGRSRAASSRPAPSTCSASTRPPTT